MSPSLKCLIISTIPFTVFSLSSIPHSAIETINNGGIAVVPDFVSPSVVSRLRADAQKLHTDGHFITDGLAGYGTKKGAKDKAQFDPRKDRAVFPAYIPSRQQMGPFVSTTLGDADGRQALTQTIAGLRTELSKRLDRPGLDTPDAPNNHEISYTRFGPGALLARHVDEHHEELKGIRGWRMPTRRSISWLVYLNPPDWSVEDGGLLRTFQRKAKSAFAVGSRKGDLQIGWLAPSAKDPNERPVFLNSQRGGIDGKSALYIDSDDGQREIYLTKDFDADPFLFLTSDFFVQNLLIHNHDLGKWFHYIEQPKSALTKYFKDDPGEIITDVAPTGGTLVMFDSVTLPHEVMATIERERWAASGWFHEVHKPPGRTLIL